MHRHPLALVALAAAAGFAAAEPGDFRSAAASQGAGATDPAHAGIWKAAVPPAGAMRGEFAGLDPIGLAAGAAIPADCSINWMDPDSGKLYCFSSATSLVVFLDAPQAWLARARESLDQPNILAQ